MGTHWYRFMLECETGVLPQIAPCSQKFLQRLAPLSEASLIATGHHQNSGLVALTLAPIYWGRNRGQDIKYEIPDEIQSYFKDCVFQDNEVELGEELTEIVATCFVRDPLFGLTSEISNVTGKVHYVAYDEGIGFTAYAQFHQGAFQRGLFECGYYGDFIIRVENNLVEAQEFFEEYSEDKKESTNPIIGTALREILRGGNDIFQLIEAVEPMEGYEYQEFCLRKNGADLEPIPILLKRI